LQSQCQWGRRGRFGSGFFGVKDFLDKHLRQTVNLRMGVGWANARGAKTQRPRSALLRRCDTATN
jgi:hypothetical protein